MLVATKQRPQSGNQKACCHHMVFAVKCGSHLTFPEVRQLDGIRVLFLHKATCRAAAACQAWCPAPEKCPALYTQGADLWPAASCSAGRPSHPLATRRPLLASCALPLGPGGCQETPGPTLHTGSERWQHAAEAAAAPVLHESVSPLPLRCLRPRASGCICGSVASLDWPLQAP